MSHSDTLHNSQSFQNYLAEKYHPDNIARIMECIHNTVDQESNQDIQRDLEECLRGILSEKAARDESIYILGFITMG